MTLQTTDRAAGLDDADRLLIYFFFDSVPFTRAVIEGRTSLGGSESALLMLARALAARGHDIHVFCAKLALQDDEPAVYDGVSWAHGDQLVAQMQVQPPDVFCSLRSTAPFAMRLDAGLNILWNQDLLQEVRQIAHALPQVDALAFVSEFHAYQWTHQDGERTQETVGRIPHLVTTNMFEPERIPAWPETVEGRVRRAQVFVDSVHEQTQVMFEAGCQPEEIQAFRHPLGCTENACVVGCELHAAISDLRAAGVPGYTTHTDTVTPPVLGRSLTKFCHISRPERALDPLLAMWPKIRARVPNAELHLCRYDSMYDATGWGKVCAEYDAKVEAVNRQVGGIVWHGQLSKAQLYDLLTSCSLMLYPGVADFAETSCIAAIEAQACGCVFVGSYKGALPETIGEGAGVLIDGDPTTEHYQDSFVEAVYTLSDEIEGPGMLADMREAGRRHVYPKYTAAAVAEQWEDFIAETFRDRFEANKLRVLRQLLHYDNHTAALLLANEMREEHTAKPFAFSKAVRTEVMEAIERCHAVIEQRAQTAEDYGKYAMDTVAEAQYSERFQVVIRQLQAANVTQLVDVACGNGSFALAALTAMPHLHVTMLDYSEAVLDKARAALDAAGMQGRYRTLALNLSTRPTWQTIHEVLQGDDFAGTEALLFDAVWCGEYVEHTAEPHLVLQWLESFVRPGGLCITSTPFGPMSEAITYYTPLQRGHTHHLTARDLGHMLDGRDNLQFQHLSMGMSPRGSHLGFWVTSWTRNALGDDTPLRPINHWRTIWTTRPYSRVVGMMLVKDSEDLILKCLKSVWSLLDGIIMLDTGSHPHDHTQQIAGLFPNVHVVSHVDHQLDWPNCGFSAARNLSMRLAEERFDPDYLLWIDSDEHLINGQLLHQYTGLQSPYQGLVCHQTHVQHDQPIFTDVPLRVFRSKAGIRFVGLVHEAAEVETTDIEKAQMKAKGLPVELTRTPSPVLDVPPLTFLHYGYGSEAVNAEKLMHRNHPLMRREVADPNCRRMALVLFMRDLVTIAQTRGANQEAKRGQLSDENKLHLLSAMRVYHSKGFSNPNDPKHAYAFPYYQKALELLGAGVEIVIALKAAPRGPQGSKAAHRITKAEPQRIFVMNEAECQTLLSARVAQLTEAIKPLAMLVYPHATGLRPADVTPVPYAEKA